MRFNESIILFSRSPCVSSLSCHCFSFRWYQLKHFFYFSDNNHILSFSSKQSMIRSHSASSPPSCCLNCSLWLNFIHSEQLLFWSFEQQLWVESWRRGLRFKELKIGKTHMRLKAFNHWTLPNRVRFILYYQSCSFRKLIIHLLYWKRYLLIILKFPKSFFFCISFPLSQEKLIEIFKVMNLLWVSMIKSLNNRFSWVIKKFSLGFFKSKRTLWYRFLILLLNQYLPLSVIGIL